MDIEKVTLTKTNSFNLTRDVKENTSTQDEPRIPTADLFFFSSLQ